LAKCKLVLDHPKFQKIGNTAEADIQAGLEELRDKVARDHRLSGFFPHQMKKFTQYQNKIWEWDFAPTGDNTRTRKGWRLFAYVHDHKSAEPVEAIAFLCWDKSEAPSGDNIQLLAEALKKFLSKTIDIKMAENNFKQQIAPDGTIISLCIECYERYESMDAAEIEALEGTHDCPGPQF